MTRTLSVCLTIGVVGLFASGCQTNSGTDALVGGGAGALVGGIIGHQFHNTAAGAAIGAGAGAATGAVVGSQVDQSEARNRALIEARLGHPVGPGAVSIEDVVAMTRAGVDENVIVGHVNANGVARPLQTNDLIFLQQNGVSPRVVQAMQQPPRPQTVVVQQAPPPPVVVADPYYDPYWGPRYYRPYGYGYRPQPAVGIGVAFR